MVSPALRAVMQAAEGAGELAGEGVRRGRAEHAVCGDVVQVDVRLAGAVISALAWRASGCPATMAVAAAAPAALRGVPLADAAASLDGHLRALGGLSATERHAQALFLAALGAAELRQ